MTDSLAARLEPLWSSPALHGNASAWRRARAPFLLVKQTSIARVGSWDANSGGPDRGCQRSPLASHSIPTHSLLN